MIQRKYKLHTSSIIIIGLLLFSFVSYYIYFTEEKAIKNRFENIVDDKIKFFYSELLVNLETLHSLSILFSENKVPTKEIFSKEGKKIINRHPAIQALEWVPYVKHSERPIYEKDFPFIKRSSNKERVRVEDKNEYFPVLYIEPLENNKEALGFDLSSSPSRLKTIMESINLREPKISKTVDLIQNKKGFLAFLPIFDNTSKNIKGFILGVFILEDIFFKSVSNNDLSKEINYEIFDTTNDSNEKIFTQASIGKIYKHMNYKKDLPFVWSRQWTFISTPSIEFINSRKSIAFELSLLIGILITIIISYIINRFYNLRIETLQKLKNKDEILYIQSRYATIGETLSNIEHQWRSPLSKLSSNIIAIQSQIEFKGMPTEKKLQTFLNNMQSTLEYMSELVDEFKNFHIQDKEKCLFTFSETLDVTLKLLEHDFSKLNVEVIRPKKENLKLYGFQNEFCQVIINILSNSYDAFIHRNISKPIIQIVTHSSNDSHNIEIKDNAGGIDEKHISNVFEQFYTTKESSGIGLHLCQMIITEHMNGKINVKNGTFFVKKEKCKGTIFTIEIPI